LSVIWIPVGVASFWYGVWMLWDVHVFPDHRMASTVVSLVVGFVPPVCLVAMQLTGFGGGARRTIAASAPLRAATALVFANISVAAWRGVWRLWRDILAREADDGALIWIPVVVGVVMLGAVSAIASTLAPPVTIALDAGVTGSIGTYSEQRGAAADAECTGTTASVHPAA
jgi:succinate dehydrogenase hydrophobic anchor subunit